MTNSLDGQIEQVKRTFGDHLKPTELAFLRETQRYFRAVLDREQNFLAVVGIVFTKLKGFFNTTASVRLRLAFDAQSFKDTFQNDSERLSGSSEQLTEREAAFSTDVIDAIEFVVCNGIGFGLIASALNHDFKEIDDAGSMKASMFNPKISGWAKYHHAVIEVGQDEDQ